MKNLAVKSRNTGTRFPNPLARAVNKLKRGYKRLFLFSSLLDSVGSCDMTSLLSGAEYATEKIDYCVYYKDLKP